MKLMCVQCCVCVYEWINSCVSAIPVCCDRNSVFLLTYFIKLFISLLYLFSSFLLHDSCVDYPLRSALFSTRHSCLRRWRVILMLCVCCCAMVRTEPCSVVVGRRPSIVLVSLANIIVRRCCNAMCPLGSSNSLPTMVSGD